MPLNEFAEPEPLNETDFELSPIEKQNRFGQKYKKVSDIGTGFFSNIAIRTNRPMTPEEYWELSESVKTKLADLEPELEITFGDYIPEAEGHQCDLHMTTHLRLEPRPVPPPVVEPDPEIEPESDTEPDTEPVQ